MIPSAATTPGPIHILSASETCNIGPAELRRRRQGVVGAAASTAVVLGLFAAGILPRGGLPLAAPLIGGLVVTWLQVRNRFCVNFGVRGVVGMGDEAGTSPASRELLAAHRRRALGMIGWGAAATLAWALAAWLLVGR